jgi:DNA-binding CsgD family transcriptional regulator
MLTRVLLNLCADQHRAVVRLRAAAPRLALQEPVPGPDDAVCESAEAAWLRIRATELPSRERDVLTLRAAGRSVQQTADELRITYKAAEGALTRARIKLQGAWRLTLAALGVLLTPRLRWPRRAALVAAAPAVALTAITWHAPAREAPRPSTAPAVAAVEVATPHGLPTVDQLATEAAGVDRPGTLVAPPEAVTTPSAAPRASETAQFATGPIGDRQLVGSDGVTVTDEHTDETLVETLQRCLTKGVIITLEESRCAE